MNGQLLTSTLVFMNVRTRNGTGNSKYDPFRAFLCLGINQLIPSLYEIPRALEIENPGTKRDKGSALGSQK